MSGTLAGGTRGSNLLNVAVTRAKNRVFLVGSKEVWGSLSHFSFANSQLLARVVGQGVELA